MVEEKTMLLDEEGAKAVTVAAERRRLRPATMTTSLPMPNDGAADAAQHDNV